MNAEYDMVLMSLVIFIPSIFALGLVFFPRGSEEWMRWWTLLGTALTLVVSLWMFIDYYHEVFDRHIANPDAATLQARAGVADQGLAATSSQGHAYSDWVARYPWIKQFGIDYYLGVDGISMPLVLLTTVLSFLGMLASWNIDRFVRGYCMLFLLLETGMVGTFLALDFFLFYIFWEIMLLPMYFLIGVWGGPKREYAAIKFFLYTLLGSVFILIAMLGFYFTDVRDVLGPPTATQEAKNTFDLVLMQKAGTEAGKILNGKDGNLLAEAEKHVQEAKAAQNAAQEKLWQGRVDRLKDSWFFSSKTFQIAMFLLLFVGFAIKVPVF